MEVSENTVRKSMLRTALDGILLGVLNPKLSLFFLAFLPQFVPVEKAGSIGYLAYLATIFMAMTFVVFIIYGAFAASARAYIINSPGVMQWLKRLFAGTFTFLGLKLALAEQ